MSSYRKPWHQKPYRAIRGLYGMRVSVAQPKDTVFLCITTSESEGAGVYLSPKGARALRDALSEAARAAYMHRTHRQHLRQQKKEAARE